MTKEIDKYFSINEQGMICIKVDIPFKESMKRTRIAQAFEEYIMCPCGGEMNIINMLNHAYIWECQACKQTTATISHILNPLRKVSDEISSTVDT